MEWRHKIIANVQKEISKTFYTLQFQTEERITLDDHASYVDFQTNMVRLAKQLARTAQDMVRYMTRYMSQNLSDKIMLNCFIEQVGSKRNKKTK